VRDRPNSSCDQVCDEVAEQVCDVDSVMEFGLYRYAKPPITSNERTDLREFPGRGLPDLE